MAEIVLMRQLEDVLEACQRRSQPFKVANNPFRLVCTFEPVAEPPELSSTWPEGLPVHLQRLWSFAVSAQLFVDQDFGQWGLRILSPSESGSRTEEARKERTSDFVEGDVVVGDFLGDQDLLVVERDGEALVATPLDPREDWHRAAPDLRVFLDQYESADGRKYWEE